MLVLFTDTDTDVTPEVAKSLGFHLISMPYTLNGEDVWPYESFETFDSKTYYDLLRSGVIPKTFGLNPEKYIKYFRPFLENGDDILYVHFSKELSGTFSSLKIAIDELTEEFPDRKIYTIDSKTISIGSYLLNKLISNLYHQGKTIEEILEYANKERDKVAMYLYSDDLKFFRRSGRVSNFSAFMGTILGIHPIIHLDSNGFMKALTKARGRLGSLNKILDFVSELEENIADYPVIIGHADCEELAHKLSELLEKRFGKLNIEYVIVNPTAGAHCGPNSMGIAFHAKHR